MTGDLNWQEMLSRVNGHIRQLNFGYQSSLLQKEIGYFRARASLLDPHTIKLEKPTGEV